MLQSFYACVQLQPSVNLSQPFNWIEFLISVNSFSAVIQKLSADVPLISLPSALLPGLDLSVWTKAFQTPILSDNDTVAMYVYLMVH